MNSEIQYGACPHCGADQNLAIMGAKMPEPGDVVLCIKCGEWGVFENGMTIRHPTDDEYVSLGENERARFARETWIQMERGEPDKSPFTRIPGLKEVVTELVMIVRDRLTKPGEGVAALGIAAAFLIDTQAKDGTKEELVDGFTELVREIVIEGRRP